MESFESAQKRVWDLASTRIITTESVQVLKVAGRICAEDILAPMNIQPFNNSSMDGFALQQHDLTKATSNSPVALTSREIIAAGMPPAKEAIRSGECVPIMTGAPIPPGADAVVPVEAIERIGDQVVFTQQPKLFANIRMAGEDFTQGESLIKVGEALTTKSVLPLTTLGIDHVTVFKKPRVAFIATGLELVDDLSTPLDYSQIYNANTPYAIALLKEMGLDCVKTLTIRDDATYFSKKLEELIRLDLDYIISSGAVSAGEYDFVKERLKKAGADIIFHKIALKPGKPNLLARLPNGTLYFGLPGNPVASAVGLRFLLNPAVRASTQQAFEKPLYAIAKNGFAKNPGLHMILKGESESRDDGSLWVDFCDGQASFMVSPFLTMNCWIHIPAGVSEVKEGEIVTIFPLLT